MNGIKYDWHGHPLFVGLPSDYLEFLDRHSRSEAFAPREMIFHEGEAADSFYLITEGTVAIEVFANERGPVTIQTVGQGEVLGWSWLVEPYRWHFDTQATVPTSVIVFDARAVRQSFEAKPEIAQTLMKRFLPIIVERLQATRLQLLDVYHVHT